MITLDQYKQWTEAYFEATTSEEQEMALKLFLATPEAADPFFDEIKAVMGVAAMIRRKEINPQDTVAQVNSLNRLVRRSKYSSLSVKRQMMRWAAVFILGFAVLTPTLMHWQPWDNEDCVAYIDGKKTTDPKIVVQQMRRTMANTLQEDATDDATLQLRDLFSTPQD